MRIHVRRAVRAIAALLCTIGLIGSIAAVPASAATVPSAPTLLATTSAGPDVGEVTLRWSAPADDGDSPITTYRYQVSTNGGTTWGAITDLNTTGTSRTVPCGAFPAGTCTYRLYATNALGNSLASAPLNVITTVPGSPTLKATSIPGPSVGNVTLRWARPSNTGGAAITTYKYEVSTNGGTTWGPKVSAATTSTQKVVPCTAFPLGSCTYRLSATNSRGDSVASNTVTISATVTKAPVLKATSAVGPAITEVTLLWA
jgi:titin